MDFLNVAGALTTQAAPSKTSKQVVPLNVLRFARPVCESSADSSGNPLG